MAKEELFTYVDSKNIEHSITISEDDFKLTQVDKTIHDQKFQSKPTTFLKDAMKRFAKNKSSIVGAAVLGTLVALAFILPAALPQDTTIEHPTEILLAPKLFNTGTGFWDGTIAYTHIANQYDWENNKKGYPAGFNERGIVGGIGGVKLGKLEYISSTTPYAKGGSIVFSTGELLNPDTYSISDSTITAKPAYFLSKQRKWDFASLNYKVSASFEEIDQELAKSRNAIAAKHALVIEEVVAGGNNIYHFVTDVTTDVNAITDFDLTAAASSLFGSKENAAAKTLSFGLAIEASGEGSATLLINDLKISAEGANEAEEATLEAISIQDANSALLVSDMKSDAYWRKIEGQANIYKAMAYFCDFRYDTYEVAYGVQQTNKITQSEIVSWSRKGWLEIPGLKAFENTFKSKLADNRSIYGSEDEAIAATKAEVLNADFISQFKITKKGKNQCALIIDNDHPFEVDYKNGGGLWFFEFKGYVHMWKYLGYKSAPKYLFGTDGFGKDIVKKTFGGLRTSLLLGIITSAVCFSIGLVYGAIAGYFGGWTDILMERFSDILSGVPWIVVMTLVILNFGSTFWTFALAQCMTGWIGTASLTRTQFYRFKDREYILAARTLGANDFRLIFKHILPNAVGTIVTSTALMIPSVIFSEASISYLGLGFTNLDSLGVTLSDNQIYIKSKTPWLILFPSLVMALIMISFNLFGNGLRDAFNPSLKGQD